MAPKHFPLRWQNTKQQWWFASPIDYAAANGYYEVVKKLLHKDSSLLKKLTSFSRTRRLENLWDEVEDDSIAKCRSKVAKKIFQEHEASLMRGGYGGWLMYIAASAGDLDFVKELLERDSLLVFGGGEYGVAEVFYAAARSRVSEVLRLLLDWCMSLRGREDEVFRWEVVNRAVHAAAGGGNVEMLTEILGGGSGGDGGVLGYRDAEGSTVLHTAAGQGQVEVVKNLLSSYDIVASVDNRGNTALNVAAHRGHLGVVEVLISSSPSSASLTNNYGNTFLHMAVAGFSTPTFKQLDRQLGLMKRLVNENIVRIQDIINVRNNDGRTALHMAVMLENIQCDVVELLMAVGLIDLNVCDVEGNTPLDLLKGQVEQSASSWILIKRMVLAGGICSSWDGSKTKGLVTRLGMHGIGANAPGTAFAVLDAELITYSGTRDTYPSIRDFSCEIEEISSTSELSRPYKKVGSMNRATRRLKILLRWLGSVDTSDLEDDHSTESYRMCSSSRTSPIPLRQQFSRLPLSIQVSDPNSIVAQKVLYAKKRLGTNTLTHGDHPKSNLGSPSSAFSESSWSPTVRKTMNLDIVSPGRPSSSNRSPNLEKIKMKVKHGSFRLMNNYFCIGAKAIAVENSIKV